MAYGSQSYAQTTYGDGIGGAAASGFNSIARLDAVWQIDEHVYIISSQDAVWQIDENIGYVSNPSMDGLWQIDENIGYVSNPSRDGVWQADENVLLEIVPSYVPTTLGLAILADSPAGYWPLDEPVNTSTTAFDYSGNLRHGIYTGGVTKQGSPGFPGERHALLNGSSGYIDLSSFPDLVNFTIEGWVIMALGTVYSTQPLIFSERRPSSGGVRQCFGVPAPTGTNAKLGHGWYQDGWGWQGITQDPSDFPQAILQQVVVTHTNTGPVTKIFRNGVRVAQAVNIHNANPYNDGNNGYRIGASYADPVGQFWPGMMAHVAVYQSVLSEDRIAAHYAAGIGRSNGANFLRLIRGR